MIDPGDVPEVNGQELLARYVLFRSHIRGSDMTLKPDAFMPPPNLELSVTRHLMASNKEIWHVGESVAEQREKNLLGRADIDTAVCVEQRLAVSAAPIEGNPNHAHVTNWPQDKPAQKSIAQQLAAASNFVKKPDE